MAEPYAIIDQIWRALGNTPDGPLPDETRDARWIAGTTLLAGVLLRCDDLTRRRLLRVASRVAS